MTRDFWKIRYAESIYILSSRIFISIITLYLLRSGNVWLSSYFLFFYFMSRSVFGLFFAHKFEKSEKKQLLIQLILFFMGISLTAIIIKSLTITPLIFIFISIGIGFVEAFFIPVVNAFIPSIVDNDFIVEAFRKTFLIQASNNLFGIAIGMLGYQSIGFENMMWVIVVLSLISFIILLSLDCKGQSISFEKSPADYNIKKSIAIFMRYRFEPWWALSSMIINMFLASFSSLIIPYFIVKIAGGNPISVGLIEGCAAGGAIFSSCYLQQKVETIIGKARCVIFSLFIIGLCFFLLAFSHYIFIWSILAFFMGMAIVMNNISVESNRSIAIPEKNRVKIQTIHNALIGFANPLGLLLTPFIITHYGYRVSLIISSLIVMMIAISVRFIPLFYELLTRKQEDIINLYEKKYGDL
ncbi:MFS transporter [Xenorhabdus sp. DI]|uniref:MFS transporter n=2 Tax=Xenorhabdus doucetiae TaxID=351671 RepID=UPI0019CD4D03|nr:MFS transporter [Xenorhabdus sp. DI]MBD2783823.1 MFS transporter [Xenorhabdus sp. 3]MBD2787044.1 MFS transporter [Xenorhabdus sp. DI]